MNQKLVSNQEVFRSVQPATLRIEPDFKSTILYSNRFASTSPVEPTGELLQILNSSIGSAGTNVLVQLKQKLTLLEGGPWYIDLINGVIHIHNRRYTSEPVSYYSYQSENGEVLTATFREVEQYKSLGSVKSFVDNLTKGLQSFVGNLQNSIQEQIRVQMDERKELDNYYNAPKKRLESQTKSYLTHQPDKTRVDRQGVEIEASNAKGRRERNDVKQARLRHKFSSKEQRAAEIALKQKEVRDNIDKTAALNLARRQNPEIDKALKRYEQLLANPNADPREIEASKQFLYKVANGKKVLAGTSRGLYGEFYKYITIYDFAHSGSSGANTVGPTAEAINSGAPGKGAMDAKVREAVNRLLATNVSRGWEYVGYTPGTWKPVTGWMTPRQANGNWYSAFETGMYMKYKAVVKVKFKGYYGMDVYEDISKVINGGIPRSTPYTPINVGNFLNNAKNNLGRHKKEKRLECNLLVVGNPHLETCQQVYLSNVSKDYSGLWYIAKAIHKLEPSSGYTTECLLIRSMPKKRTEGTSEISTQPTQETSNTNSENKLESRYPKPTPQGDNSSKPKNGTTSGGKQTLYLDAFEVDWLVNITKPLKNVDDVKQVLTRELYDIQVTKTATGKSPISVDSHGATRKDHVAVMNSRNKLSDNKFKEQVIRSGNIKKYVERFVNSWAKNKGN